MEAGNFVLYNQNIWGNFSGNNRIANRNDLICALIDRYNADVCCFQECNPNTSRADGVDIAGKLASHYAEVPTCAGNLNYTPIFYKRASLDVIQSGFCAFPGFNDVNSKSLTWCVLQQKSTGISFGVISTHFWYKARGETDDRQRLENARIVLAYANSITLRYQVPVFVAGDLNSGDGASAGTESLRLLQENLLDVRQLAPLTTDAMTCHEAPALNEQGLYDAKAGSCTCTLDHMFLSSTDFAHVHSFTVDRSDCAWSSSDHCPLIAEFCIFKE